MVTSIEQLPNELFVEIFQYLPTKTLFESFYNLNIRLNSIINQLSNLSWTIEEDWDCPTGSIPNFASRIKILIIKHDEPIDLTSFRHIHSLKLFMPTSEQCSAIRPDNLPDLKHLSIVNLFFADHSDELCQLIFSSTFSHLERCHIDRMTFCPVHHRTSSVSLRQLTVSPSLWKTNSYSQIFETCPNLVALRLIRLRKIHFDIHHEMIVPHLSLRHLFVQYHSLDDYWFDHLDHLFSFVPNVQLFRLTIDQQESDDEFPFEKFARLLTFRLSNLISFSAKIPLNRFLTRKFNEIQRLHRLFVHLRYSKCSRRNTNGYLLIFSNEFFSENHKY